MQEQMKNMHTHGQRQGPDLVVQLLVAGIKGL